jgi:signal transduction histidine kinase
MMATLKGAFARLRPPDLDQLGLEACLRTMLRGWHSVSASRTTFRLEVNGNLSVVPPEAALSVYRIAQECINNAAKHGSPRNVLVHVSGPTEESGAVTLVVEDDGGGDPDRLDSALGFGIAGIRERVAALGGTLSFNRSLGGLRMSALLPVAATV